MRNPFAGLGKVMDAADKLYAHRQTHGHTESPQDDELAQKVRDAKEGAGILVQLYPL
jgi:hypothetical protein